MTLEHRTDPLDRLKWAITSAVGSTELAMKVVTSSGGPLGATIGAAMTDGAAFAEGAASITPIGGYSSTGLTSIGTSQAGAIGMSSRRGLYTNLRTSSGVETGTSGNPLHVQSSLALVTPATGTSWHIEGNTSATVTPAAGTSWHIEGNTTVVPAAATVWEHAPSGLSSNWIGGVSTAVTTTLTTLYSSVASKRLYLRSVLVTNGSSITGKVTLRDSTSAVLWAGVASSGGGGFAQTIDPPRWTTSGASLQGIAGGEGQSVCISWSGSKEA